MKSFRTLLIIFSCVVFSPLSAREVSNYHGDIHRIIIDSPWHTTVRQMEEKLGSDSLFVSYLKDFQRIHFNVGGDDGYEGACFLPGKFHETDYAIKGKDQFTIYHGVSNNRAASFSIVKSQKARSLSEIRQSYEDEIAFAGMTYYEADLQNGIRYESIPIKKFDAFISKIHQFETINIDGDTLRKTRVYVSEEDNYEFWVTLDKNEEHTSLESLIDDSIFNTFRLGTQCTHYSYVDDHFTGGNSLRTLFIEHPLQILLLDGVL